MSAPARCLCGGVILADCEDWRRPVCPACWQAMGCPLFEPHAPLVAVVAYVDGRKAWPGGTLSVLKLSCGHEAWLAHGAFRELVGDPAPRLGQAWPCVRCVARAEEVG